ncbi:MAG: hypothetical protein U0R77_07115 [Mycolicibacterium insubricum]|uniref:hypothetical protein n=1 Tax=Mycolicibacterium insubricum TaxID=444597 RepID=UPI00138C99A5|nr:hypothetical protein [Mycolicibacterium insubricum]BBZ67118.1 hypothetical protein MINS_25470 [Mycolicibacterium insubricum]
MFPVNYHDRVAQPVDLLHHPVVTAAIGTGAYAWDGASLAYRLATRVPVFGSQLESSTNALSRRGEDAVASGISSIRPLATAIAIQVVQQTLAEMDLTKMVRDQVDINALVNTINIDAIIDRIDLIGLANSVIDGVDLPKIIRDSTMSVTTGAIGNVRATGERADAMVSGIVNRVLGRSDSSEPAEVAD